MQLLVKSLGAEVSDPAPSQVELREEIFQVPYNEALVHQVVVAYLAQRRRGTSAQRNRSEVRGGGRKPWRQKRLGRARAGSIRSPLWRGGGVTFAAKPRDYAQKVNRKMYRGAMRAIFSELLRQERLELVDRLSMDRPHTGTARRLLAASGWISGLLFVQLEPERNFGLSVNNLPKVDLVDYSQLNPYQLVAHDRTVLEVSVLEKVQTWLA